MPWAGIGACGSALLAVFATIERPGWFDLALGISGACLLVIGWLGLATQAAPLRWICVAWCLPLLLVPPLASADAYAYAAQGWLTANGFDSYQVPMGKAAIFGASVDPRWAATTAVYPPLSLWLQAGVVAVTGSDPYWSVIGMRLFGILGVLALLVLVPAIAADMELAGRRALWFTALNPLVIIHFMGGAHNDALMVAMVLLAVWVAPRRGGLVLAMIALAVAAGVKQAAVVAGPGIAWYSWANRAARITVTRGGQIGEGKRTNFAARMNTYPSAGELVNHVNPPPAEPRRHGRTQVSGFRGSIFAFKGVRTTGGPGPERSGGQAVGWIEALIPLLLGGVIGAGTFAAFSWASGLGWGWLNATAGGPGQVTSHAPLSWLRGLLVDLGGLPPAPVDQILLGCSAVLVVAGLGLATHRWQRTQPLTIATAGLGLFAVAGVGLQPWYLVWAGALFPFSHWRVRAWQMVLSGVVALSVSGVVQVHCPPPLALAVGAVLAGCRWRILGSVGRQLADG